MVVLSVAGRVLVCGYGYDGRCAGLVVGTEGEEPMAKPGIACPCCVAKQSTEWPRACPHCGRVFKGIGWQGIASHLGSEAAMASHPWTFKDFWDLLCDDHGDWLHCDEVLH